MSNRRGATFDENDARCWQSLLKQLHAAWRDNSPKFFVQRFPWSEAQFHTIALALRHNGYVCVTLVHTPVTWSALHEINEGFYVFLPKYPK